MIDLVLDLIPRRLRMRIADMRGRGEYANYVDRCGFIFIHIPKTGGVAISAALGANAVTHRDYRQYLYANPRKFARTFKFTVVRNPWDRVVSSYFFLRAGGMTDLDREWADANLSNFNDFGDFVRRWLTPENAGSWIHFVPQHTFVADEKGKVMVDYVGRFETLAADFLGIKAHLGAGGELAVHNASVHKHFADYYDAETEAIVRNVYARDIDLFGYADQSPSQLVARGRAAE